MAKTSITWLLVSLFTGSSFSLFYASRHQFDENAVTKIIRQEVQLLKTELSAGKSRASPALDSLSDHVFKEKISKPQHLSTIVVPDYPVFVDEL